VVRYRLVILTFGDGKAQLRKDANAALGAIFILKKIWVAAICVAANADMSFVGVVCGLIRVSVLPLLAFVSCLN